MPKFTIEIPKDTQAKLWFLARYYDERVPKIASDLAIVAIGKEFNVVAKRMIVDDLANPEEIQDYLNGYEEVKPNGEPTQG